MKVTFVLPAASFTGGARVAFDYADLLRAAGHDTAVLFPMIPYRFRDSARRLSGVRAFDRAWDVRLVRGEVEVEPR